MNCSYLVVLYQAEKSVKCFVVLSFLFLLLQQASLWSLQQQQHMMHCLWSGIRMPTQGTMTRTMLDETPRESRTIGLGESLMEPHGQALPLADTLMQEFSQISMVRQRLLNLGFLSPFKTNKYKIMRFI
jgi:hypothetical protein